MPKLFLIVGPSGVGKSTLIDKALANLPGLRFIPSYTTRDPRPGEREGINYFFVSENKFLELEAAGEFLEVDRPFGSRFYGVPRRPMEQALSDGYSVLRAMSVEGVKQIANSPLGSSAFSIFLYPGRGYNLEGVVLGRDGAVDAERSQKSLEELGFANQCDAVIISKFGDPESAYTRLVELIARHSK